MLGKEEGRIEEEEVGWRNDSWKKRKKDGGGYEGGWKRGEMRKRKKRFGKRKSDGRRVERGRGGIEEWRAKRK